MKTPVQGGRTVPIGRAILVLGLVVLFFAMLIVSYVALLLLKPRRPITITQPTMTVQPKRPIRPGEPVTLTLHYCSDTERSSLAGLVLWSHGEMILLPSAVAALPQGCHHIGIRFQTPAWLAPGNYKAYLVKEYRPTIFEDAQVVVESDPIIVTTPDGKVTNDGPIPVLR